MITSIREKAAGRGEYAGAEAGQILHSPAVQTPDTAVNNRPVAQAPGSSRSLPFPARIPLPTEQHSAFNVCCMMRVCNGCSVAVQKRGMFDCPFCRTPISEDDASTLAMVQARVDAKVPAALELLADKYFLGTLGLEKDVPRAIDLLMEAAERGSIDAHYNLGVRYSEGGGVAQNKAKAVRHWETAACQGHVQSRHNLGYIEIRDGNYDRAVKHFSISAKMGHVNSLDTIKEMFVNGFATKQQYAGALKGYQFSVEETKSPERDEAKVFLSWVHNIA